MEIHQPKSNFLTIILTLVTSWIFAGNSFVMAIPQNQSKEIYRIPEIEPGSKVEISPNGEFVAVYMSSDMPLKYVVGITLYNTKTKKKVWKKNWVVRSVCFAPDSKSLALIGGPASDELWIADLTDGHRKTKIDLKAKCNHPTFNSSDSKSNKIYVLDDDDQFLSVDLKSQKITTVISKKKLLEIDDYDYDEEAGSIIRRFDLYQDKLIVGTGMGVFCYDMTKKEVEWFDDTLLSPRIFVNHTGNIVGKFAPGGRNCKVISVNDGNRKYDKTIKKKIRLVAVRQSNLIFGVSFRHERTKSELIIFHPDGTQVGLPFQFSDTAPRSVVVGSADGKIFAALDHNSDCVVWRMEWEEQTKQSKKKNLENSRP